MRTIYLLIVLASVHLGSVAYADSTDELQALQEVKAELVRLQSILDLAEAAADPDDRIRFRYDWLRRDLAIIRHGIQAQFDAATCPPTKRQPIRGDYRR